MLYKKEIKVYEEEYDIDLYCKCNSFCYVRLCQKRGM